MRIGLVATGLQRIDARTATSDHASTRLRALIPSAGLARRGHGLLICSDRDLFDGAVDAHLSELDVLIVHKVRLDLGARLDRARDAGVCVIVDLCDHVFLHPVLSAFYPGMLARADLITAATEAMAEVAGAHVDLPVRVIPDAVEGARGAPAARGSARSSAGEGVRCLWFGRPQNVAPLIDALPRIAAIPGARVEIVTGLSAPLDAQVATAAPQGLAVALTPWTEAAVETGLARCDLVVLPADPGPSHRVKSANRMERALWGGRMVVATPTRAAEPWADLVYLYHDLTAGIRRALAEREHWPARIAAAQERLIQTRSADALALHWEAAAVEVTERPVG